ncbi:cytochrome P450 93A3-like [Quercus robur]|uniref:cytochrome P450 93A3-like n=1 Tax=Quercus robur TaxID=38942 RepID=UPI0021638DC4|nr:cytochrome P450 93A3-like [Quercus robur]
MVLISLYAIMRDLDLWSNPYEFQPKRKLGKRACPGSTLGLSMAHIAVATLVQCFDWKVVGNGEKAKAKVNTEVTKAAFIHMAHPLKCLPIVKFNPFDSVM